MKPELVVALDLPEAIHIPRIVDAMPLSVRWFKVGLELFTREGPRALDYLHNKGKNIFLDLKLHDIPNTVAQAVRSAIHHRVSMLTIHASGGSAMIRAAAKAAAEAGPDAPAVVAVTTLTSLNENDLQQQGITRSVAEHTMEMGRLAMEAGANGLVCSALEVRLFRDTFGPAAVLVTPGIRPSGSAAGDQKRIATPDVAVRGGATFLVVGRPITQEPDPRAAAESILRQMHDAANTGVS